MGLLLFESSFFTVHFLIGFFLLFLVFSPSFFFSFFWVLVVYMYWNAVYPRGVLCRVLAPALRKMPVTVQQPNGALSYVHMATTLGDHHNSLASYDPHRGLVGWLGLGLLILAL